MTKVPLDFPLVAVTLIRSPIGRHPRIRDAVKALGLNRMYRTVYHRNNPQTRGQLKYVRYFPLFLHIFNKILNCIF